MSYKISLEKAGCEVLAFKEFGDYQGSWLAFVVYNGERGIVEGSYGSCSGCDAFQAVFDYGNGVPVEKDGKYYRDQYAWEEDETTKDEFDSLLQSCNERLADFGRTYLSGGLSKKKYFEDQLLKVDNDDWFSSEEKEKWEWAIAQEWNG